MLNVSHVCFYISHTPALFQVGDGSVTNVTSVHSSREANGCHTLIGRLQGRLQCRPDCSDSQDPPTARDHASILEGSACMKNLQLHILKLGQT